MWWFKKKVKEKPVCIKVSRYKHFEDRFVVEVHKDEHRYKIGVYDRWSRTFMSDKELEMEKLQHGETNFDLDKDVDKITEAIKIEAAVESLKNKLRNDFTENWNKKIKPKKRKKIKKEVKIN